MKSAFTHLLFAVAVSLVLNWCPTTQVFADEHEELHEETEHLQRELRELDEAIERASEKSERRKSRSFSRRENA